MTIEKMSSSERNEVCFEIKKSNFVSFSKSRELFFLPYVGLRFAHFFRSETGQNEILLLDFDFATVKVQGNELRLLIKHVQDQTLASLQIGISNDSSLPEIEKIELESKPDRIHSVLLSFNETKADQQICFDLNASERLRIELENQDFLLPYMTLRMGFLEGSERSLNQILRLTFDRANVFIYGCALQFLISEIQNENLSCLRLGQSFLENVPSIKEIKILFSES